METHNETQAPVLAMADPRHPVHVRQGNRHHRQALARRAASEGVPRGLKLQREVIHLQVGRRDAAARDIKTVHRCREADADGDDELGGDGDGGDKLVAELDGRAVVTEGDRLAQPEAPEVGHVHLHALRAGQIVDGDVAGPDPGFIDPVLVRAEVEGCAGSGQQALGSPGQPHIRRRAIAPRQVQPHLA